jgi:hypothetical protein
MKTKIINIGLNRAGSTSLNKAMEILGYKSAHYKLPDGTKIRDIVERNLAEGLPPLEGLDEWDFLSDFAAGLYLNDLYYHYPDSLWILTTRSLESWLISMCKIVIHNRLNVPNATWTTIDLEGAEYQYNETHRWVREVPQFHKKLEIDLIENPAWEPLCNFLGKSIPDIPFPHLNKSVIS